MPTRLPLFILKSGNDHSPDHRRDTGASKLEHAGAYSLHAWRWSSDSGKLYPFVFITIACGAISGFHSLISSGTTPKMIAKKLMRA